MPSFLVATSVTSLGNAIGAINLEPIGGIDFFAGVGSANSGALPSGLAVNSVVPGSYTLPSASSVHVGFATGVAFDLSIFTSLIGKPSSATLP
jgi:hypothetical protein